jgi:predicted transcriptional regulator
MLLHEMSVEIKGAFGAAITEDTEELITQFNQNFETIESNFNELRKSIEDLK